MGGSPSPKWCIATVLEGESLLNDASALLIYRLAVAAVATRSFSVATVAPTFLLSVGGVVLLVVVIVRFVWTIGFELFTGALCHGPGEAMAPVRSPSLSNAVVVSWAGMRGIVTLAGALALPEPFPYRDLIVLTAFSVVLGTLVIQGLTLKPLLRLLRLQDDGSVEQEVEAARAVVLEQALAALGDDASAEGERARRALRLRFGKRTGEPGGGEASCDGGAHNRAIDAARQALLDMRADQRIGDKAFHRVEEMLDRLQVAADEREGG